MTENKAGPEQVSPDPGFTWAKIDAIIDGFFWLLPNLLIGLGIFIATLAIGWALQRGVARVGRMRGHPNLGGVLGSLVNWIVFIIGLLITLTVVVPSIKPSDILSTLGIGSVAIGFAFKDILQNLLAGILILTRRPFRSGDQIVVRNYEGTVEGIEARATFLKTYDGRRVVIPNSDVYTQAVVVNTAFPIRRTEVDVGIALGADLPRAIEVAIRTMVKVDGVVPEPLPDALPWGFGDSSTTLKLRWWTKSDRATVVRTQAAVLFAVKAALDEAGIEIAVPQRKLTLRLPSSAGRRDDDESADAGGPQDTDEPSEPEPRPAEGRSPTARTVPRAVPLSARTGNLAHDEGLKGEVGRNRP